MAVHLVADVHLTHDADPGAERFRAYLRGAARTAEAVYVLGDLFDVWIGDDGSLTDHRQTAETIGELGAAGIPVYFMRGNRDFGIGERFVAASGVTVLDDPCAHRLGGVSTLLTHGDSLCTNDPAQQRFRARYTNPRWRARMGRIPLFVRRLAARRARHRSTRRRLAAYDPSLDIDAGTLVRLAADAGATRVIHGHTHRPIDDRLGSVERHVLADWDPDRGEYLSVDRRGVERVVV